MNPKDNPYNKTLMHRIKHFTHHSNVVADIFSSYQSYDYMHDYTYDYMDDYMYDYMDEYTYDYMDE